MDTIFWTTLKTKWGTSLIAEWDGAIVGTTLPAPTAKSDASLAKEFPKQLAMKKETPLLKKTKKELAEYLAGKRKRFTVPLLTIGTPFQKQVWKALQEIPYGETRSYQEIAKAIGKPKATRAIGAANHCNRLPLLIPCHRVIGKDGSLTGFGGGLPLKQRLLDLESSST